MNLIASINGDTPAWSPDGKSIAFASQSDTTYTIYVVDANGENLHRLTNVSGADDSYPTWRPIHP
jgi:Tol biopolymer transport system component